jgi:hypothetical protein
LSILVGQKIIDVLGESQEKAVDLVEVSDFNTRIVKSS